MLGPALEAILPGGARRSEVETGMTEAVTQLGERSNASALAATAVLEVAAGKAGRNSRGKMPDAGFGEGLLRRAALTLAIAATVYVASYIGYRATHTALNPDTNQPCVTFPQETGTLYRFFRPLSYADHALTGMDTHAGREWAD